MRRPTLLRFLTYSVFVFLLACRIIFSPPLSRGVVPLADLPIQKIRFAAPVRWDNEPVSITQLRYKSLFNIPADVVYGF